MGLSVSLSNNVGTVVLWFGSCLVPPRAPLMVYLSLFRFVTLTPGDVFLTGTPPGVGVFRKPAVYLKVTVKSSHC